MGGRSAAQRKALHKMRDGITSGDRLSRLEEELHRGTKSQKDRRQEIYRRYARKDTAGTVELCEIGDKHYVVFDDIDKAGACRSALSRQFGDRLTITSCRQTHDDHIHLCPRAVTS